MSIPLSPNPPPTDTAPSNVSFASLPLFVPTIISDIGVFTTAQSNGLSAPPYLLCFFMILLLTWVSDRLRMRGPVSAFAALVAAIGFQWLLELQQKINQRCARL